MSEEGPDPDSIALVNRVRAGDERASEELFFRYFQRLMALIGRRFPTRLSPRLDPEDVVQSAYRSFFTAAQDGRYVLKESGDLWKLLVAIAINKLHRRIAHHNAAKRAIDREVSVGETQGSFNIDPQKLATEPTPDEAVALREQLELVNGSLSQTTHRTMFELSLQGLPIAEISQKTMRTEHHVRRVLKSVRKSLEQRLLSES